MNENFMGQRFGKRTVIDFSHRSKQGLMWNCLCDCGKMVKIRGTILKRGSSQSCGSIGCQKHEHGPMYEIRGLNNPLFIDLTDEKFGRWRVLGLGERFRIEKGGQRHYYWLCQCDCGIIKEVYGRSLKSGSSKSCGCCMREVASKICKARVGEHNPNFGKRGEEIWNFKGYNRKRPRNADYEIWRSEVFKRDNFTCLKCHVKGGYLVVHHKKPWKDTPNLRLDKKNGATLCEEDHIFFHKKYGFTKCTEANFYEFIGVN